MNTHILISVVYSFMLNNDLYSLSINLFGAVDNTILSHEIRGLNIVVRLVKAVKGAGYFYWPHLIASESSNYTNKWLKYDYDAIVIDDTVTGNYRKCAKNFDIWH